MNKQAFTLIELMVYVVLFSVVAMMVFGFCSLVYTTLSTNGKRTNIVLMQTLMLDAVRRDVMSASMMPQRWDVRAGVFEQETLDARGVMSRVNVGWDVVKKSSQFLMRRTQGVYDFTAHRWTKKNVSLMPTTLRDLRFGTAPSADGTRVVQVLLEYADADGSNREAVVVRNRVLA